MKIYYNQKIFFSYLSLYIESIWQIVIMQIPRFNESTFIIYLVLIFMVTIKLWIVCYTTMVFSTQLLIVIPTHDISWVLIKKISRILEFLLYSNDLIITAVGLPESRVIDGYSFGENLFPLRLQLFNSE